MKNRFAALSGVALVGALLSPAADGAVMVNHSLSTTAPSEPATFSTMSIATLDAANTGVGATRELSQTFSVDSSINVTSMTFRTAGPTGGQLYFKIFAVPGDTPGDADTNVFPEGANTLPNAYYNSSPLVEYDYTVTTSDAEWLTISFTGDPLAFNAGQLYQVQFSDGLDTADNSNIPNLLGFRLSTADAYAGGRAYSTRDDNGNPATIADDDLFLSITGTPVPEPASLALVGLGGALMLTRRKRA